MADQNTRTMSTKGSEKTLTFDSQQQTGELLKIYERPCIDLYVYKNLAL